jgi:predicted homoserine dehydrogenase-like protein
VVAIAKRDLTKGEVLDGVGGFCTYGLIDTRTNARSENLLPIGLSEGCRLLRDIPKDQALGFEDVTMPPTRLRDELWNEQAQRWPFRS